MATGGQSAFQDTDGKQYLCYHSRFDHGTEYHEPCVKQVFLNREGWPVLAPYTTKGETISEEGYSLEEMAGTDVMTFSAVGDNKSVWGAKYE